MSPLEDLQQRVERAIRGSDRDELRTCVEILSDHEGERAQALRHHALGMLEDIGGNIKSAIEHGFQALDLYEHIGDRRGVARAKNNLGLAFNRSGMYPDAMRYYYDALDIAQQIGDKPGTALIRGNVAVLQNVIGNLEESLKLFEENLEWFIEIEDHDGIAQWCNNIGFALQHAGRHDEALTYFERALENVRGSANEQLKATVIASSIELLLLIGREDDSLRLIEEHRSLFPVFVDAVTTVQMAEATILANRGEVGTAKKLLQHALDDVTGRGRKPLQIEVLTAMQRVAKLENDLDSYITLTDQIKQINDEILGQRVTRQLVMEETAREIEEREQEHQRQKAVLYSTLPPHIADRVVKGEKVNDDHHDDTAVIFLDIVGFTDLSSSVPPGHVVHLLDAIFNTCDEVVERHGVTKIKTIGDSYMAVAFPEEGQPHSTARAANVAIELLTAMSELEVTMPPDLGDASWVDEIPQIDVRIGMHIGPVIAGVIGKQRLQYDVWGDTVNVASRMESTGEPGRIQVSSEFHEQLSSRAPSHGRTVERGTIEIKGKGSMTTYWLEGADT